MNQIEEKSHTLIFKGQRLQPISSEENPVGFCSRCEAELLSLGYYSTGAGWLVSARCSNGHLILMHFDLLWNWLGDLDAEVVKENLVALFKAARQHVEHVGEFDPVHALVNLNWLDGLRPR